MKIYTHQSFTGFWPIGVAAVMVADSPQLAIAMLNQKLRDRMLPGDAAIEHLVEIDPHLPSATVINDGNY